MSDSFQTSPRLVVGIAASSGGLDAFRAFFSAVPVDSGLAFVLLPNFDAAQRNQLLELLGSQTQLAVHEAVHGVRVEANHVYILPPAGELALRDGKLFLSTDTAPAFIDEFLCSLAGDQGENAVAVILSGSGSQGTLGLTQIKLAGGIVMAQDPATADSGQMPTSAIATGLVDRVLSPEQMPAALIEHASHPWQGTMRQLDSKSGMAHKDPQKDREENAAFSESVNPMNVQLDGPDARQQTAGADHEENPDSLRRLLTRSDIGILALDCDMCVRMYTPLSARLLNLRPDCIDRPIGELPNTGAGDMLEQQAAQVIDSMIAVDRDVWSGASPETQRCYLRRIVPYAAGGTGISGAIITFIDVTERRRMEERLEAHVTRRTRELGEREIRLQAIMNSVVDAIVIIGEDGLIQSANPPTEQIFGYSSDELIGHNVSTLMPSPYREEHDRYIARFLETRKPRIIGKRRELTGQRRDGSIFPLELTVTQIDHLSLFAGVIRDLSEKRALEREVANTSALEQERIGREIHDGIGQQLTGLNILAVSLKNELAAAGYADSRKLDDVIEQLTALIGNSRTLARGLAPVAVGPRGLLDALTRFAGQINDTTGITCSFRHNLSNGDPWDSASATQIYRIAQEAANNALKYADAGRIDIALSETDGTIELLVSDDGRGFDLDAVQQSDGFGLRIMQYRAGILGGQLSIDTAPGAGTTVKFRMSLHAPRP